MNRYSLAKKRKVQNNYNFLKNGIDKWKCKFQLEKTNFMLNLYNICVQIQIENSNEMESFVLSATKGIHQKFSCTSSKFPLQNQFLETINEFCTFGKQVNEQQSQKELQKAIQLQSGCQLPQSSQFKSQQDQLNQSEDGNIEQKKKNIGISNWEQFQHPYKHLIFSKKFDEGKFKRHLSLVYRGVIYAKRCLKSPSDKFISKRQVKFIEAEGVKRSKTLLLDLDETLIHSSPTLDNFECAISLISEQGDEIILGVSIRPYCSQFLANLSQYYEIYIFTASSFNYACAISKLLDPKEKYIAGILSRENCMATKNGFYIKDLRCIKNRNLKSMVIVDNLVHSFGFQIENGIPVAEWRGQKNDRELQGLEEYLKNLSFVEDVRIINEKLLKVSELEQIDPEILGI